MTIYKNLYDDSRQAVPLTSSKVWLNQRHTESKAPLTQPRTYFMLIVEYVCTYLPSGNVGNVEYGYQCWICTEWKCWIWVLSGDVEYVPSGNVDYVLVEVLNLYRVEVLNMDIRWKCWVFTEWKCWLCSMLIWSQIQSIDIQGENF